MRKCANLGLKIELTSSILNFSDFTEKVENLQDGSALDLLY